MSDISSNLRLPYLASGQAQKHVTVNESLTRLDALVQLAVVSAATSAEPSAPADGQTYILPAGKTGANWGGMSNGALAYYRDGAWEEIAPRESWLAYVKDADRIYYCTGAAWADLGESTVLTQSGSFTPTVTFATPGNFSPTYVGQQGRYKRVGQICHYWIYVQWNSNAFTTASGQLYLEGLPFTVASDSALGFEPAAAPFLNMVTLNAADRWAVGFARHNTTQLWFYTVRSAANVVAMDVTNFPASTSNLAIRVGGSYRIA
ncbi:MAG: DUF2793 domain-containing protein [Hyphomonadaceae bacterium]